ncbi:MAG: hypothetical protein ABIH23_19015, partial [bacterium]
MSLLTARQISDLNKRVCPGLSDVSMGTLLNDLDHYRNPSGGTDYYVDSNSGDDADDGLTWDTCMATLTAAMAASHANIAASSTGWAARNRIFYKGDSNAESLTTLAQKTDIIGVGSGGGHRTMPQIVGTHTIGAGAFVGCRFFNMGFVPTANGDNIFTVPATSRGLEFHGCWFESGNGAVIAGSAIVVTA